jgi:hypothetical protein
MFINEPLRNKIALYGILLFVYLISILLAFDAGTIYQKEHGPPGNECKSGTYRTNGFWEEMLPPSFPTEAGGHKEVNRRHTAASCEREPTGMISLPAKNGGG